MSAHWSALDGGARRRARALSAQIIDSLVEKIQNGTFPRGQRLPNAGEVVEAYGVSRTVVREALSGLQAAGLVETYHGRGSYVLNVPPKESFEMDLGNVQTEEGMFDLLDLRSALEQEAASIAAARHNRDD